MGFINDLQQIGKQIEETKAENKKIDEKINRIKRASVKIEKIQDDIEIMKKVIKAKGQSEYDWRGRNCDLHKEDILYYMVNEYKKYLKSINELLDELNDERRKLEKIKIENDLAIFKLNNKKN